MRNKIWLILPVIINILYKIIIYIYFFPQKICITKRASSIHFWSSKYKDGLSVVDVTFFILKQKTENVQEWFEQKNLYYKLKQIISTNISICETLPFLRHMYTMPWQNVQLTDYFHEFFTKYWCIISLSHILFHQQDCSLVISQNI